MDRRLRELQRQWKSSGDTLVHAAYLQGLVRNGTLQEKHLIVAAFLGHRASQLAVPKKAKKNGVIYKDRLIKNVEIKDYIHGLSTWGFRIQWRASLGICKLINNCIHLPAFEQIETMITLLEAYIKSEDAKDHQMLSDFLKAMGVIHQLYYQEFSTKPYRLQSLIYIIVNSINNGKGGHRPLLAASIDFPDYDIKQAIRSELYPFLLGENK